MLLQNIVEKLDAELDRLQRLRDIIAGLRGGPALVPTLDAAEDVAEPARVPAEVQVQHIPARVPREGRRMRLRMAEKPHTALTSAIPARPVVVLADALAKENAAKKEAHPVRPKAVEGTLGAMIRALGQQGAV